MEIKRTKTEPLVQLVGKNKQPLILNDQDAKNFPRTKVEEAQMTAARKQWDQEMFEKQIEKTILKEKQSELGKVAVSSTETSRIDVSGERQQASARESISSGESTKTDDYANNNHHTSAFHDVLSESQNSTRHIGGRKQSPKGRRVTNRMPEKSMGNDETRQPKSTEVDQIALAVMNNDVRDFGSVVVPSDLLDFQVKEVIQDTLRRVSSEYKLIKLDLTAYKQQVADQPMTQYFEYGVSPTDFSVGCLHFVYQAMPALFGQGFTLDGGTNLDQVNWLAYIQAYDWKEGDLTERVKCDYTAVNANKAGIYPVIYTVSNEQHQTNQLVVWMKIRISKPVIKANDLIMVATLKPNSQTLLAQVTAQDVLEGNLINRVVIDDSTVDYQHVGQYSITYCVQNNFGLEASVTRKLTIEAQTPALQVQPIQLKLSPGIENINWLNYVRATDTIDGDLTDRIQIDDQMVDLKTDGQYPVTFKVTNQNGQTVVKTTQVTIVIPAPIIELAALELPKGVNLDRVDWLEHVKASDENDGDLSEQVTVFYGEVQPDEIGEYPVYYMVRNHYGKQTTKQIKVWIH